MKIRFVRLLLLSPLILAAILLFVALGGVIVKYLWNWLLPSLFSWPQITFWQALALLALCRILFGGFGVRGGPGSRIGSRVRSRYRSGFRRRMAERWERMTPEERERFRQRMRERFGSGPFEAGQQGS